MHPTVSTTRLVESWLYGKSPIEYAESDESLHRIVESKLCQFYLSLGFYERLFSICPYLLPHPERHIPSAWAKYCKTFLATGARFILRCKITQKKWHTQERTSFLYYFSSLGCLSVFSALRSSTFALQTRAAHLLLRMSTGHSRCALIASRSSVGHCSAAGYNKKRQSSRSPTCVQCSIPLR